MSDNSVNNLNVSHWRQPLSLPPCRLKIVSEAGHDYVYDCLREKMVALTPEEWVRQHFVSWLIRELEYPAGRVANEVTLMLNRTLRRADTVVYDRSGCPLMVVEYKRPTLAITREVFEQVVRYNMTLGARFIVVSNGVNHYCCKFEAESGTYAFLRQIPRYDEIDLPASGV